MEEIGVVRDSVMGFTGRSLRYGFRNFYRLGTAWWSLTVAYAALDHLLAAIMPEDPEGSLVCFAASLLPWLLLLAAQLPYLNIGLHYSKTGATGPGRVKEAFASGGPYLLAVAVFASIMTVGFLFAKRGLPGLSYENWFPLAAVTVASFAWLLFWGCRLFPYLMIVLDRRVGPRDAFSHSMKITGGQFLSIITFLVAVAVIAFLLDLIPLSLGDLIATPALTLAMIHAYRELEARQNI